MKTKLVLTGLIFSLMYLACSVGDTGGTGHAGGGGNCDNLVTDANDAVMAYFASFSTADCEAADAAIQAVIDGGCDDDGDFGDSQEGLPCSDSYGSGDGDGDGDIAGTVNDALDQMDALIAAGSCEEALEFLFNSFPGEPEWSETVACTTMLYDFFMGMETLEDTTDCGFMTYFSTSFREINDAGCILSLEPVDANVFFTAFLDSVDYLVENSSCEPAWEFIMETIEHLDEPDFAETEACDELWDAFEDGLNSVEDTTDFCEMATAWSSGLRAIIDNDCLLGWAEDDDDIDEYFFQTWK